MANQQFDPSSIPRFSVIRLPYNFEGNLIEKLFVVICHRAGNAICIKATSKVAIYRNNPQRMAGCVHYAGGALKCFPVETVVQPDNQFPIAHTDILKAHTKGVLEVHPPPPNFEQALLKAIRDSATLDERLRERLLMAINGPLKI